MKKSAVIITLILSINIITNAQNLIDISDMSTCEQAFDLQDFTYSGQLPLPEEIGMPKTYTPKHRTWDKVYNSKKTGGFLLIPDHKFPLKLPKGTPYRTFGGV